ncbi:MAG TPA: phosphodiester glycosidase family protein [Armatimonadota bacterium]|jgi:exopolysaccharide biosynthesis protein
MELGRSHLAAGMFLTAALGLLAVCPAEAARSIAYTRQAFHGVTAHVVTVNLNDPRIRVSIGLPRRGIGHSETFAALMHRHQPAAAITGTFFSTDSLLPVGDIVTSGRRVYSGPAGAGFCVASDNTTAIRARRYGRTVNLRGFETALCTGPTLLRNGANALYPRAEGYRDPSLWALRPRAAVGRTRHNKLVMAAVPQAIHLSRMRSIMKALGCVDALGLDGGSSTAFYAGGRMRVRPGRRLTNVLTVSIAEKPAAMVTARLNRERDVRLAALQHKRRPAMDAASLALATIGAR